MGRFQTALAFCVLAGCSSNKTNEPSASTTPNGGSTAPSGQEASSHKKALVRFSQTVPGNQRMDLWFGDMKVFSNVAYKEVTPYVEVPAERHDFKLEPAGDTQTTAPATNSEGLSAGGHYTIVAEKKGSKDGALTLDPLNDNLKAPAGGKAKLRIVNAAVGLGKIDVVGPDGKIFGGIGENSSTSYKEVAPIRGTFEIRRSDKSVDALRIPNMSLQPGKLYTIFIVGGDGQRLEALPVTDQLTPPAGVGG
jgi:hypothetical protein